MSSPTLLRVGFLAGMTLVSWVLLCLLAHAGAVVAGARGATFRRALWGGLTLGLTFLAGALIAEELGRRAHLDAAHFCRYGPVLLLIDAALFWRIYRAGPAKGLVAAAAALFYAFIVGVTAYRLGGYFV